jgi:hypothetical protein
MIAFTINVVISQDKMPNLKYIQYIDGIDCSRIQGMTKNLGDTLIFMTNNYYTQQSFLNICYHNKCLRFSKQEMGINDLNDLIMSDAVHCNKNNNNLWIATKYGIIVFDGEKCFLSKDFDSLFKSKGVFTFCKDTKGNIFINTNYPYFVMYDGINFIKLELDSGDFLSKSLYPGTNMVEYKDKLYYVNFKWDLAYFDTKNKTYNSTGIKKVIDSLYVEKLPSKDDSFITLTKSLQKGRLCFRVGSVKINKIFYYDEKNLGVDNFIADSIVSKDTLVSINNLNFDGKGRKWVQFLTQKNYFDANTVQQFTCVIDSTNHYYKINTNEYKNDSALYLISGVHGISNGLTYCSFELLGFLVDDPLGLSVEELNSQPSFFLTTVKPNPFRERTKVEVVGTQKAIDNMNVEIFDCLGKSIKKVEPFITYYPSTGKATLDLETEGILPGFYYLVLNDGNDTRTMPIIIK